MSVAKSIVQSVFALAAIGAVSSPSSARADGPPERPSETTLEGSWTLWPDRDATWADDELVPPPVDLAKLPVHAPTCGWDGLARAKRISVSVPGTVEQYLWDDGAELAAGPRWHRPDTRTKGVSFWSRRL